MYILLCFSFKKFAKSFLMPYASCSFQLLFSLYILLSLFPSQPKASVTLLFDIPALPQPIITNHLGEMIPAILRTALLWAKICVEIDKVQNKNRKGSESSQASEQNRENYSFKGTDF